MKPTVPEALDKLAALGSPRQIADFLVQRQIKAFQTLMRTGMKLIVRLEKGQRQLHTEIKQLAVQQKRTDQKIDRWFNSSKDGSNGHSDHKRH